MSRFGVDYSMSRPGPAALRAAGYTFACRYLAAGSSKTAAKALTKAEADQLRAGGVDIVSNWEIAPGAALNGRAQGVSDAQRAAAAHAACGGPANRPIYFSVDIDTTPSNYPAIDAYFAGIISVLGLARTGVYGEYDLVKHCLDVHDVQWAWETYAWSSGRWDSRVKIRQVQNGIKVNGADCDRDEAMADDFGQWGYQEALEVEQTDKVVSPSNPKSTRGNYVGDVIADVGNERDWLYSVPGKNEQSKNPPPPGSRLDQMYRALTSPPTPAPVQVDATAVATALAGNAGFLAALAKAVNDDAAKRLES